MKRREFLIGVGAVGLATARPVWAQGGGKLARVGMLSRNFDAIIKTGVGPAPNPARTLDFMDLPQAIADRFGVHNLVLQHSHFVSTEDPYLKDFRDRVAKAKSQIIQIDTDFQGSHVSATGFSARAQGIDLAKMWIDHAEALGCPRVLVASGSLAPDVRQSAIDSLKILAEYGKAHKVTVVVENRDTGVAPPAPPPPPAGGRGGAPQAPAPPATWQVLVEAAKATGIGVVPDTANFPNDSERAAGLKALYPLAAGNVTVHVIVGKGDVASAIRISKDASYKGLYSVGVEPAPGADPYAATKAVLDELVRLI